MFYEVAPGGLEKARENFPGHRARIDEFHARGELLMVGTWANPAEGALAVFSNREAAEAFAKGDPFVLNGVVGTWTLRDWNEVLV
jgi:uncharacterized protein YciI